MNLSPSLKRRIRIASPRENPANFVGVFNGTDYVTVPGLSVTDKVTLVGWDLGAELVVNGTFDTGSSWWDEVDGAVVSGELVLTGNGANYFDLRKSVLYAGGYSLVQYEIKSSTLTGTGGLFYVTYVKDGASQHLPYLLEDITTGVMTLVLKPDAGTKLHFFVHANATGSINIDNVSVKEITLNGSTAIPTVSSDRIDFSAGNVRGILINDELVYSFENVSGAALTSLSGSWGDATLSNASMEIGWKFDDFTF